ncbi:VPLPA-CTERM sorting domain-containing protein [Roseibacterium sp. SDUM158017]|uniref:VPLPA-CTERM sorting domain-containing protein n=1 Tax=Roseicyclus salinarum TaxID=3036773 RepID=UPI0024151EB9|nr:VPLPA-CTERM sorting domain-containing protein [Roseibacterium sp. SDUM158017]MDG4649622.1 VPLPA-CTERM sorting domain-containing protein [Roseibacterium sp. SDUM158017]
MKRMLTAAAAVAALAAPAAATTVLDFTTSGIGTSNTTGFAFGGNTYSITGSGALTDATHGNNVGCVGEGWDFACDATGRRFDVGFGIAGTNPNEVDDINNRGVVVGEYVEVTFKSVLRVLGFAGMLTYDDSMNTGGTETVILEYSSDGGLTFNSVYASALFDDNDPSGVDGVDDDLFSTVGLAFRKDINVFADVVRFRAGGYSPFDDDNSNITAAGLIVAPVPVPAALPLMLAGMGAFGWAARRKKRMAS